MSDVIMTCCTLSIRYKENLTVFAQMPLNQG